MTRHSRRVAAAVVAVLLLPACRSRIGDPLPSYGAGGGGMKARRVAKVVGDAKTGCVWLEGRDGDRQAVLWPPDHRVRFDPVRIYDARDRLVMAEGSLRTLGGGSSEAGVDRLPAACRTGETAWHLASVGPER